MTTLKYSVMPEFNKLKLQASKHPHGIFNHPALRENTQARVFFYWPAKKILQIEGKKEYLIKPGETSLLVPFSGITAFPENDKSRTWTG